MRKYLKHSAVVEALNFVCVEEHDIRNILSALDIYVNPNDFAKLYELDSNSVGIDVEQLADVLKLSNVDFETACVIIFEAHVYQGPDCWMHMPPILCWLNRRYGMVYTTSQERRFVANYCKRMIMD